jgi:cytochrome c biogenesis protein CcdA
MVGTIAPMVHRGTEEKKFVTAILSYTLGCILGAASFGICMGVLGKVLLIFLRGAGDLRVTFLGCGTIGLIYSLREVGIFRVPAPQICRQVPERRRHQMSNEKASLCYGLELGVGIVTRIPISSFYVIVIWALLTGSLALGCISVVGFGVGKALPVILLAGSQRPLNSEFSLINTLSNWQRPVHYLNGLILCFVAIILIINGLYR